MARWSPLRPPALAACAAAGGWGRHRSSPASGGRLRPADVCGALTSDVTASIEDRGRAMTRRAAGRAPRPPATARPRVAPSPV
eukprot:5180297-Prymnesium_polylepis.1